MDSFEFIGCIFLFNRIGKRKRKILKLCVYLI
jgi:hypothetical protein